MKMKQKVLESEKAGIMDPIEVLDWARLRANSAQEAWMTSF